MVLKANHSVTRLKVPSCSPDRRAPDSSGFGQMVSGEMVERGDSLIVSCQEQDAGDVSVCGDGLVPVRDGMSQEIFAVLAHDESAMLAVGGHGFRH